MFDASPHRELHAKVIPWIGAAENLTALWNDPLAEPGAPVRPQIASAGRLRGSFGAGRGGPCVGTCAPPRAATAPLRAFLGLYTYVPRPSGTARAGGEGSVPSWARHCRSGRDANGSGGLSDDPQPAVEWAPSVDNVLRPPEAGASIAAAAGRDTSPQSWASWRRRQAVAKATPDELVSSVWSTAAVTAAVSTRGAAEGDGASLPGSEPPTSTGAGAMGPDARTPAMVRSHRSPEFSVSRPPLRA